MNEEIAKAEAIARQVAEAVAEVEAIYFVGSRLKGTANEESDLDMIAFVTGSLRALSPNWVDKGTAPAAGFASSYDGVPIHWLLLSADYVDRSDLERNAHYRASPVLLVYDRARTVPPPVPPSADENAD